MPSHETARDPAAVRDQHGLHRSVGLGVETFRSAKAFLRMAEKLNDPPVGRYL
jgi:hypothetical protein